MASNKVATVVMLDVGSLAATTIGKESFFDKCQWCLLRIIQRTIFSGENDELAVVLFGCQKTDNALSLTVEEGMYENICEFTPMQKPTWKIYEKIQKLTTTNITRSNWAESIVVSLNYLKEQTKGKRFKDKQLIVLCNFAMEFECDIERINQIAASINLDSIKLIVIGVDINEDNKDELLSKQLPGNLGLMLHLADKLEQIVFLSFLEAEEDIVYYEKKRKMGRFTKVNLDIGSNISIPVRWIKINLEPTRIKWCRKSQVAGKVNVPERTASVEPDEIEISYVMDTQKTTKFGDSQVVLSYADLEAMKRETGPPSCLLLGCVKRQRISRDMLVGKDIYLIVPERAPRAQRMISAFIDALIDADKFGLVRRVTIKNGKIKLGILVPVSDEIGKELYFLQLPFAEYSMTVPDVVIPEADNNEILSIFNDLIDAMIIPDKPKEIFMKDPMFQLRCHILHLRQTGQLNKETEGDDLPLPDFIAKLCDPYPELRENAMEHLKKLEAILPINIEEELIDVEKHSKNKSSLKNNERSLDKEDIISKDDINQPEEINKNKDEMDWEKAETQEWPEDLKDKYKNISKKEIPSISLNENILSTNKYTNFNLASNIWKEYGTKDQSQPSQQQSPNRTSSPEYGSATQQMMQGRHIVEDECDTDEMLARMRTEIYRPSDNK